MEFRQFGNTDMKVSVLGFGGAEIGFSKIESATVAELLDDALDAGLNVIDTAECYLQSEELIGHAVSGRRKDYYLFTKCGHPDGQGSEDWSPDSLLGSIERSLVRLQTDHLDLVQLHSCTEAELRKGDVIAGLQRARDKGLTRYIGYSGDGQAAKYAIECKAFDTLQTSVSIADQEAISLTLPPARKHNLGVIVKRPIANAIWLSPAKPENAYYQTYWERLNELKYEFLKGKPGDAVSQALRFTLSVPGVHTAIVGTTKPGRWRENAGAASAGALSSEDFERIRAHWAKIAKTDWVGQI